MLKSRESEPDFLPLVLPPLPPPPSLLPPLPPLPSRSVPVSHRPEPQLEQLSPLPPPRLTHSPPTPRRARRSRRRGRWRRPPAPAGPRGRSEEPERPTEASWRDAAAEDEPAERAVSPVSAEARPRCCGDGRRLGGARNSGLPRQWGSCSVLLSPGREARAERAAAGGGGHTHGCLALAGRAELW